MDTKETIKQIIPAVGWFAVWHDNVTRGQFFKRPLTSWALVELEDLSRDADDPERITTTQVGVDSLGGYCEIIRDSGSFIEPQVDSTFVGYFHISETDEEIKQSAELAFDRYQRNESRKEAQRNTNG